MLVGIYLYYIKVFSLTSRISLIFTNTIIGYMANIFSFWRDMGTFITPLASFSSFFFLQFYFTSLFSLSRNSSIIINYLIYTQKYIYFCYLIIKTLVYELVQNLLPNYLEKSLLLNKIS